jgi:ubiquinone/menaquinone biosynthesis C-methylase UbiE
MQAKSFVSALRFKSLTGLYDFLIRTTFPERKIKQALIAQLHLRGDEAIMDFGCGTGTLSIMIKERYPEVNVVGIDVDEQILKIAERKIKERNLNISLLEYDGENLDFPSQQRFDKIVSSFVIHHIPVNAKKKIFAQLCSLLKPGGELHIADFGKGRNIYMKAAFGFFRRFDSEKNTSMNAKGSLPQFISANELR